MKRSLILFLAFLTLIGVFMYLTIVLILDREPNSHLRVTFLDVGQGDATFIESPAGTQMLIDGGRDATILRRLPEVMGYFDRTIDIIVATHPDSDHINGLTEVMDRFTVHTIIMTDNVNDTPAYDAFMARVENERADIIYAQRGQVFDLGRGAQGSTTLTVLFPDRPVRDLESNTASIVAKLSYGEADVLLTGDSPEAIEMYLVGMDSSRLQSEVLKVGHHGSRTSTAPTFVGAVRPQYGIISAGKDNDYGHPHKEVLETLRAYDVATKNTAESGSISLESDGRVLWFK